MKKTFTQSEIRMLEKNPHVASVNEEEIRYRYNFKHRIAKEYEKGKKISKIFKDAGIEPEVLGFTESDKVSARQELACVNCNAEEKENKHLQMSLEYIGDNPNCNGQIRLVKRTEVKEK